MPKDSEKARILYGLVEEYFSETKDYRRWASTWHSLLHVIFITLCAVTSGARNLKEVAEYAKDMEEWFCLVLGLSKGVPSYGTFWQVFKHLEPEPLSKCFVKWAGSIAKTCKAISIDGKAQRGTAIPGEPNSFIHIVSAWASEEGLTLGQLKVDGKSNEITAIPKLLELINIQDSVITIDAMGTQKEIAKKIIEKGGDYILALKGNQSSLQSEVINYASQAIVYGAKGSEFELFEQKDEGHGRTETRRVFATDNIDFLKTFKEEWKGLMSIVWIESERVIKGKVQRETRYYISSLSPNPEVLGNLIRSHWGIENSAHWVLDVAFREDEQKAKAGHVPENMSLIRRIVLNLLRKEKTAKVGIAIKQQKAGRRTDYLLKILEGLSNLY